MIMGRNLSRKLHNSLNDTASLRDLKYAQIVNKKVLLRETALGVLPAA